MNFYKLKIKYKGQRYQGWQKQAHSELTVQGQLEKALSKIVKSTDIHSIGSGRTDSGVHALAQVVRIQIPFKIESTSLLKAINSNLPSDIECLNCEDSTEGFHPVFGAKDKTYRYVFSLGKRSDALSGELMTHLSRDLDISKMKAACLAFIGEHDFADFYTTGTEVATTIRKIFDCSLEKYSGTGFLEDLYPEYFVFEVKGSGFLKQMVRNLVGHLLYMERNKLPESDLIEVIAQKDRRAAKDCAPARGLYLYCVKYPQELDNKCREI